MGPNQCDRLGIRYIATRNYIPLQTAFNGDWLMFPSLGGAKEFRQAFPGLAIASRIEKLEHERRQLAAKI